MAVRYSEDPRRGSLGFALFVGGCNVVLGLLAGLIVLAGRAPVERAEISDGQSLGFAGGEVLYRMGATQGGYPQIVDLVEAFAEGRGARELALSEPDLNLLARTWFDFTPQVPSIIDQLKEQGKRSYLVPGTPNVSLSENLLLVSGIAQYKPLYQSEREVRISLIITANNSGQARVDALYLNSARIPPPLRSYVLNRLRSQLLADLPASRIREVFERSDSVIISRENLRLTQ